MFHWPLSNYKESWKVSLPSCFTAVILNLHSMFHVSQVRKYVPDPSHIIQMDEVQVRENLTVEACL